MKALVFNQKGKAEDVLALVETTLEHSLPNEITIRTIASPINPNDFMFIEKQYRLTPTFPQIAGFEGCGIVIDNHSNNEIPNGTLVAYRHKNAWAELVNIPKEKIIMLPADFPIEKAAQLSLNPLTAWALIEQSQALPNDWIILSAGTSAVSKLVIQFAKHKGIKTIVIVRDKTQTELLRSLGANVVLSDENLGTIGNEIIEASNNEVISCFIDAVGGDLATHVIPCIGANGTVICYGLMSANRVSYHNADIIFKLITIQGFGIDKWTSCKSKDEMTEIWEQIIHQLSQPNFQMKIAVRYPLHEYIAAFKQSKEINEGKILFYF